MNLKKSIAIIYKLFFFHLTIKSIEVQEERELKDAMHLKMCDIQNVGDVWNRSLYEIF